MRIKNNQLRDFILDSNLIPKEIIEEVFLEAEKNGEKLGELILKKQLLAEEQLRQCYAYILGVPFVDLKKVAVPETVLQLIPEPIAKKYKIVAFEQNNRDLKVAMLNPEDLQTIDFIRKKTRLKVIACLTSEESIQTVLKQYEKSLKAEFGDIIEKNVGQVEGEESEEELEKVAEALPIITVVDTLIKHAILQNASDIHIEPDEKEVRVRYRIDGILHDAMTLPRSISRGIVARIKVLSNLKLDEHRVPQDGRFKIEKEGTKISFRVSILPIFDGEKIVMRLLDESSKGLTLEHMGLRGKALENIHEEIKRPNGMILVTGPTGSGKTTTLYTVMDILNTPEVNISTVEDPVEYRMPRVNQTQIYPKVGLTFASGLRSLLRQDPDIIMVGEIRDKETMEMAIHAAMTGHLVLSTLHTNSAAGTIPRLIDMGAEPFLLASTINVIIAQRLVRKLCPDCREAFEMTAEELEKMSGAVNLKTIAENIQKWPDWKNIQVAKKGEKLRFYRAKGCEQCSNEGYKGRLGIFEVLAVNETMKRLISEKSPEGKIEEEAKKNGMITMMEDGLYKILEGQTSLEEVLRVTTE